MKTLKHIALFLVVFVSSLQAEPRAWTSKAGTAIEADLVSIDGGNVALLKEDGKTISIPIRAFSKLDQDYIRKSAFREKAELTKAMKGAVVLLKFSGDVRITNGDKNIGLKKGAMFPEG